MPYVALAAAVTAGLLLPVGGRSPLGFAGDGVVFLYLLALSSVALAVAGSASSSPFAFLGASREMMLLFFVEPVVACALFVVGLKAGSFRLLDAAVWHGLHGPGISGALAGVGLLLALLGYMGRLPFDLPEAEQELMGGATIEFGGRRLALLRWTLFVRWLVVAWLVAEVFVPTPLPAVPAVVLAAQDPRDLRRRRGRQRARRPAAHRLRARLPDAGRAAHGVRRRLRAHRGLGGTATCSAPSCGRSSSGSNRRAPRWPTRWRRCRPSRTTAGTSPWTPSAAWAAAGAPTSARRAAC
jgi:hypothetical protein